MNLLHVTEQGPGSASGEDGLFSLEEIQSAALGNRALVAERLREAVIERCTATPSVEVNGGLVDLTAACAALAAWDGRLDTSSSGALVWRELLGRFQYADVTNAGKLYAVAFDPDDPLATPNTLVPAPATGPDPILVALAQAIAKLEEAGFEPTTPLGEAQFTRKGDTIIPIHGGNRLEGTLNAVGFSMRLNTTLLPRLEQAAVLNAPTQLTEEGYLVNTGTSFLMALEFTEAGPRAEALLSYSQSTDPTSPYFTDQTELFSSKAWRPILFREDEIASDPELVVEEISAPR